mmetsp:Transcript_20725/g.62446  ORF Transcript_20725/g.62446 Transcript_20725/m.62446 type:complete len:788 (+) Transcript_20725:333-2696(+)|eukprot:CAMPEP_0206141014 /NCGR_PEP_ID=MMETSP1473-20131121/11523_1 /ASSEMBLY_ACC=CAM_ASM_001109 /TAXON_ID=1461547 /ORGANISM="Stichococcus sp, Strain RCC1054" /LENGTH=787 /DNA_ID=CAMNT_0053535407 /DNA_START=235 /DNA_END=2598 /DNA_ORIENTATION=-
MEPGAGPTHAQLLSNGPAPETIGPLSFQLAPAPGPAAAADVPEPDAQSKASLAVLTQIVLLAAALVMGQALSRRKITVVGDSAVALLLGLVAGILCYFIDFSNTYLAWMAFSKEFFFYGLLPPIIFEAGYSLETKPFVRNVGAICAYAFAGTFISTVAIGLTMWLSGLLHLCYRLSLIEALIYGSIISATDPVTVLSVFQRLNADEDLYALVFGESVLNDAVAITLYKTFLGFFNKPVTLGAVFGGFRTFCWSFVGSMTIGTMVGFVSSLLFKTKLLRSDDRHSPLEANIVILFAFASYFIADGVGESGIVAVLFCGMTMANYTRRNLSQYAQETSIAFFRTWATMAETFVFVYIGASVFLQTAAWGKGLTWMFLVIALAALAHSRLANIWLCSKSVNLLRPPEMAVPLSHQTMLWWSGLRGAIAFALSLQAVQDLPDGPGEVMLTCTFFIILITVLFNGGGCAMLIEKLNLKAPPSEHRSRTSYHVVDSFDHLDDGSNGGLPIHQTSLSLDDDSAHGTHNGTLAGRQTPPMDRVQIGSARSQQDLTPGPVDRMLGTQGADAMLHSGLEQVRQFNRAGIQDALSGIDEKFLQPFFVAPGSPGASATGDKHTASGGDADVTDRARSFPTVQSGNQGSPAQRQWQQERGEVAQLQMQPLPLQGQQLWQQSQPHRSMEAHTRRRSVTDGAAETTAQPLSPHEREPASSAAPSRVGGPAAPARGGPSGAAASAMSHPGGPGKLQVFQALQSRVSAALKPGGGPGGGGRGAIGRGGSGGGGDAGQDGRDRTH